jgi:hypothetical protein
MLQQYARSYLTTELAKLPKSWAEKFMWMYGRPGQSLDEVIRKMPADKLDRAMEQVRMSLKRQSKTLTAGELNVILDGAETLRLLDTAGTPEELDAPE